MHRTYRLLTARIGGVCRPALAPCTTASSTTPRCYTSQAGSPPKSPQRVTEDVNAAAKRLAQLKWALENKRLQLEVLESLESKGKRIPAAAASITATPSTSPSSLRHHDDNTTSSTVPKHILKKPLYAQPADMHVRLPKVERDFLQPANAEIARVAILGAPNAGKSTLVNELVQSTVSIVSTRPHSTRERIRAIMTKGNKQVVFYDTPGVVTERNEHRLNRELVTSSWKAIEGADHLLVVVDSKKLLDHTTATEDHLFARLSQMKNKIPATLVLNKMDLVRGREEDMEKIAVKYKNTHPFFEKTVYTSIGSNDRLGIKELEAHLLAKTQRGSWLFPAKQKTDQGDLQRVEDLIRAEVFGVLKVPYKVKQRNTGWTELADRTLRIDQDLLVERPGLKKILVGTGGQVIRDITLKAREKIGRALHRRVLLVLQVKVHSRLLTDPTLKK